MPLTTYWSLPPEAQAWIREEAARAVSGDLEQIAEALALAVKYGAAIHAGTTVDLLRALGAPRRAPFNPANRGS